MNECFFVSDLHGRIERYRKLFDIISIDKPEIVFIGGDILPHGFSKITSPDRKHKDFITGFLAHEFKNLKDRIGADFPKILIILGNDDGRLEEDAMLSVEAEGVWEYVHDKKVIIKGYPIYGYSFVPPTPFQLKDWEKYDVSRYVDPGCVSPEEGMRTISVSDHSKKYSTIQEDLKQLAGDDNLEQAIFLFHSPPYKTNLDRAALDGKTIDPCPTRCKCWQYRY
ncbi:MAG: metallophosphoesterase [Candidatus Electryonea clarkiae]|nr:metallophosphoesterase [Candidatus Electryonea clarkiae]MDP8286437.1 metallophosphoesterase [Candidatus Electryonea clarkiae]